MTRNLFSSRTCHPSFHVPPRLCHPDRAYDEGSLFQFSVLRFPFLVNRSSLIVPLFRSPPSVFRFPRLCHSEHSEESLFPAFTFPFSVFRSQSSPLSFPFSVLRFQFSPLSFPSYLNDLLSHKPDNRFDKPCSG